MKILLVDDEPERHEGLISRMRHRAKIVSLDPSDVTLADLADIDLVSVDEYFADEWYGSIADLSASLRNEDGLAVAAAFRSQARGLSKDYAVSLHSGELARLAAGLPVSTREGLTAAQHDLDWVFAYGSDAFGERLVDLAVAVRSATQSGSSFREDAGASWLQAPDTSWKLVAQDQIEDCRPPAHALAENTGGRSYVRWLAQRILPYPTFLYDQNHSANILGILPESFQAIASLGKVRPIEYRGPLQSFLGQRWWRAGWQGLLREAGVTTWDTSSAKAEALSRVLDTTLLPLPHEQTVVTYDLESRVVDVGADLTVSVRLNLDGWPVFADDPWASSAATASDPSLLRLVARADRAQIEDIA